MKKLNHVKTFESFKLNEEVSFNPFAINHLKKVKKMMRDASPVERRGGVLYRYFSDRYLARYQFWGPGDYRELKSGAERLKSELEDLGYIVELDMQYGLRLNIKDPNGVSGDVDKSNFWKDDEEDFEDIESGNDDEFDNEDDYEKTRSYKKPDNRDQLRFNKLNDNIKLREEQLKKMSKTDPERTALENELDNFKIALQRLNNDDSEIAVTKTPPDDEEDWKRRKRQRKERQRRGLRF